MQERKAPTGVLISLLIIGLWTIIPLVQVDLIYRLIVLAFLAILVLSTLSKYSTYHQAPTIAIVLGIGFLLADIVNGGFSKVLANFAVYFFLILIVVFFYLQDSDVLLDLSPLLIISAIAFTIVNFVTIKALSDNGTLIRSMVLDSESSKAILKMGIGGYGLVFSQTVMIWCSVFLILYGKLNWSEKLIYIVYSLSAVYLIISAQFTVALFSLLTGFLFFVVFRKSVGGSGKFIAIILLSIILGILWMKIDTILAKLYIWTSGTSYQDKISSFMATRQGELLSGDAAARKNVYLTSLTSFLRSPLWGTIFNPIVGGHSTILDLLAKYGIVIGGSYIYLIISPLRYMKRNLDVLDYRINAFYFTVLSSSLVSLILDPLSYHYWFAWIILLPIAATVLNDRVGSEL